MAYKWEQACWENLQRRVYDGEGEYRIPIIHGVEHIDKPDFVCGYTYMQQVKNPEDGILHFFCDDYRFASVWDYPDRHIETFRQFRAVCSHDFSMYFDLPKAFNVWNHYRKHWIGAYLEEHGIKVIPTSCWTNEDDYDWCFDGMPKGAVVAVSSMGCAHRKETKTAFTDGYKAMLEHCKPPQVLWYGDFIEDCKTDGVEVIHFDRFPRKSKDMSMTPWKRYDKEQKWKIRL